ncbi:hypothetical protein Cycma_4238 [Cyclobacterium marinum DSM 745]|uniref:Uncharacterized protein n=1 Tax=Cyclobacterium marinum (strain ATCC 25205 / DSM 745 / LMG 13164 / NCIMB 1802) TaxID=880070 RepID=G0IVE3_CYCMS|nr:hypothetical protein Cycma_4238 [Cyclobacterium marinum DSM 745]
METPASNKCHNSQMQELQVLHTLDYTCLTPYESLAYLGNITTNVILYDILLH